MYPLFASFTIGYFTVKRGIKFRSRVRFYIFPRDEYLKTGNKLPIYC